MFKNLKLNQNFQLLVNIHNKWYFQSCGIDAAGKLDAFIFHINTYLY